MDTIAWVLVPTPIVSVCDQAECECAYVAVKLKVNRTQQLPQSESHPQCDNAARLTVVLLHAMMGLCDPSIKRIVSKDKSEDNANRTIYT